MPSTGRKATRAVDRLVAEAEQAGFVTADQVFDVVDPADTEALDDIVARLNRRGVPVVDSGVAGARIAKERRQRNSADNARGDALSAYLREISSLPALDRDAEVKLATAYHQGIAKALCAVSDARIFQEHLLRAGGRILRGQGSVWEVVDRVRFGQDRDPGEAEEALRAWIERLRTLHLNEARVRRQINRRGTSESKARDLGKRLRELTRSMHETISEMPLDSAFIQRVAEDMVRMHQRLEEVDRDRRQVADLLEVRPEEIARALRERKRNATLAPDGHSPGNLEEIERRYRNVRRRLRRLENKTCMENTALRAAVRRYRDGMLQAQRARDALVMSAQKLVLSSARYYGRRLSGSGMEIADLISAGNIGLIRAVELFDPSRGNRFSTFAGHWVRHTMIRTIHTQSRTVYVPPHVRQQMSKILAVENELLQKLGRPPTDEELASASQLEVPKVRHTIQSFGRVSSIDRPLDPNDSGSATYGDVLADEGKTPDEALEGAEHRQIIRELAERLEGRERKIVFLRMGWNGEEPKTLAQVGEVFGISRQRVEQLEKRALARLRVWARSAGLVDPAV